MIYHETSAKEAKDVQEIFQLIGAELYKSQEEDVIPDEGPVLNQKPMYSRILVKSQLNHLGELERCHSIKLTEPTSPKSKGFSCC